MASKRTQAHMASEPATRSHVAAAGSPRRATVIAVRAAGEATVRLHGAEDSEFTCELLEASETGPPKLRKGDVVLVLPPDAPGGTGIVLGRIAGRGADARRTVMIEADEELTIRCGAGSVTIRKNGKVLIQGLEIVSHARGKNRIRGGSIQLN